MKRASLSLYLLLVCSMPLFSGFLGCGPLSLTLKKQSGSRPYVTRSPRFLQKKYKKLLILPPRQKRSRTARFLSKKFYLSQVERLLIQRGYRVIAQNIVIRIQNRLLQQNSKAPIASNPKEVLTLGRRANADAILVINTIRAQALRAYFVQDSPDSPRMKQVTLAEVRQVRENSGCVFSTILLQLRFEAKLIDVKTGEVLWIGSHKLGTSQLLPADWRGVISSRTQNCSLQSQNFDLGAYLRNEEVLKKQVAVLLLGLFKKF